MNVYPESTMCETKEDISIKIIDDLIEFTAKKGKRISIQDLYDLKNLFYFFDFKYVKQGTVEESKLIFISNCIYYLIIEKENIKQYKYITEVIAFKRNLPFIIDINLINSELVNYFKNIYSESAKIN